MTILRNVKAAENFMGRLTHNADLLDELTRICVENNIKMGRIDAIGAVKKACVGFYDQDKRVYEYITYNKPLEILNLTGNVSIKDGAPMVHAHVTLADHDGTAFGGHLAKGTIVFACEYTLTSFSGELLERGMDGETSLPLWKN
ncbi:MAG: DNA-binding protein [Deltaproteobacteria bacterium]|nr:DNA-binding protein [Deltaproteobacteria bacterium]